MKTKEKWLNFRPIAICALLLCLGVFIGSLIFTQGFSFVYLVLESLIILTFVAVVKFKAVLSYFGKHFLLVSFGVLMFIFGMLSFIINATSYINKEYSTQVISATATVTKIGKTYILIDNVKADSFYSNTSGEYETDYAVSGSYYCYVANGEPFDFKIGDNITFNGKIDFFEITNDNNEINSGVVYNHIYGRIYNASVYKTGTISKTDLFMDLRNNVRNVLHDNMSNDSASVAYSMLFGDKGELSDEIIEDFKTTGVMHLLAVSGLHIGFLVALISVALKAMKVKPKVRAGIIFALCFIYAWICGFTPSVVRAMIMTITILIAGIGRKQYDMLNALSFSIILILIANSGALFHIGFQLSVLSVLYISFFGIILKKWLSKILPGGVASALSVTFCTQLGTLPILIKIYGSYSAISILANLIIVPVASLAFEILVASLLVLIVVPSIGLILRFSQLFYDFIIFVARAVADSKFLTNLTFNWLQFIILAICATLLSQYVFLKRKTKLTILLVLLVTLLSLFGVNLIIPSI